MNIPIGMMMVGGSLVGLITISVGYFYAAWANARWPIPVRDSVDAPLAEIQKLSTRDEKALPPLWFSLLPIAIPIVLISLDALAQALYVLQQTGISFGLVNLQRISDGMSIVISNYSVVAPHRSNDHVYRQCSGIRVCDFFFQHYTLAIACGHE